MTQTKKSATPAPNCGTRAGYKGHNRRGEAPCPSCRSANAAYVRDRARKTATLPTGAGTTATAPLAVVPAPGETTDRPDAPSYLQPRGRALWDAVVRDFQLSPGALEVLTEACRISDRLERMAAALASRNTLWFELGDEDPDAGGVPVVVNHMVGESRNLQNALRQALDKLGVVHVQPVERAGGDQKPSLLDELARKRAERLAREG
ncbi:hypothetical protein [Corynebacterium glyciniphilum]|uniref:hypothetical protein n=1 Tax=Corynebacterium glyciniphilum TaxID=1404244 RepID=UPI003FD62605